jgi:hypothetical protein
VEKHNSTSAIVNVDAQAAELRDFFNQKYFPGTPYQLYLRGSKKL